MDSVTQAVLGASIGEVMLGKKMSHRGAVTGAIIATIPDLDVLLYLFYDKLEMLSIHRGFSHSIVFSLLGAFIIAFILSRMKWFQNIAFSTLLLFTWLCLFTHIVLDAFTAYGTQLLLPFSNARVGLDSINVIDPVYTIPLAAGLTLSLWIYRASTDRSRFAGYGLLVSSLYLLFTLINKEGVKSRISQRFGQEHIEYRSLLTMPVGIGNIHWYGVARGQDSIYLLKHNVLSAEHGPVEAFPINESLLNTIDAGVAETMRWFAKGFYTVEKADGGIRIYNLQVDMRGIVRTGDRKAPTVGYFEVSKTDAGIQFSSGSLDVSDH